MRRCILLFFWLLPIAVRSQPVWLLHQSYAEKFRYFDSLSNPSFQIAPEDILKLEKWANDNNDAEFAYSFKLCYYQYLVQKYWDIINLKKTAPITVNDIEEYQKEVADFPLLSIDAMELMGSYYWRLEKNSWALEYFLDAYHAFSKYTPEQFPAKRRYIYNLAGSYYRYTDYENAIRYFKEALATKGVDSTEYEYAMLNTLGICYQKLKKYDSSELYLYQVYNRAVMHNERIWMSIAGENIGMTYFCENKYAEAIPFLERDTLHGKYATKNPTNATIDLSTLAEIYFRQNQIDKAENLMQYCLQIIENSSSRPSYKLMANVYRQMYKISEAKKNYALAAAYADSEMTARDSAVAKEMSVNQTTAEERTDFIKHNFDIERLRHRQYVQEVIRNSLIIIIILVMLICILFINRQRLKQNKLWAEKRNAESERNAAVAQLDGFKKSVHEKNLLIEHFSGEMEKIKQGEQEKADNELISKLERSVILTDEQWEEFRLLFEKVHRGFFAALKKKIPDLTQSEIRFLALTKLKLTTKEMAAMLGISAATIRGYRHRLRKKLDMDKDGLIDELLEDI